MLNTIDLKAKKFYSVNQSDIANESSTMNIK